MIYNWGGIIFPDHAAYAALYKSRVNDLNGMQANLEQALRAATQLTSQEALPLVVRLARAARFMDRPGTRKVYVYADKDMMKMMMSFFVQYQNGEAMRVREEIPRMLDDLKGKKLGKREKAQAGILKKYYRGVRVEKIY